VTRARVLPVVAILVVAALLVGVVGVVGVVAWRHHHSDPYAAYCATVADHRGLIASATEQGATTGLIAALPSFEALRAKAPSDIADDWTVVVTAIAGLQDALQAAGIDPSTYDAAHPPSGTTTGQRDAIAAAAARLGSERTSAALAAVDQEARDVCHTPLML
jgi:hypothetical protein